MISDFKHFFYSAIAFTFLAYCCQRKIKRMTPFQYTLSISPGTRNYKVTMFTEDSQSTYQHFLYDTVNKLIILHTSKFFKISMNGNVIDTTNSESLGLYDNGIIRKGDALCEWLINNDIRFKVPQNVPPPVENIYELFDKMYKESEMFLLHHYYPTFKIEERWITYDSPLEDEFSRYLSTSEFLKKYPIKPANRFIPMQEIGPDFGVAPEKRDTSLLKSLGYAVVDKETEDWGITKHNYSAGFYNMELYLPGGDTLRFRHFGALGINLEVFRVPKEYGGRDDVFFIAQDPNPLYPELSTGGVYVIRPRYLPEEKPYNPSRLGTLLQHTEKKGQ